MATRLAFASGDASIVPRINEAAATSAITARALRGGVTALEGSGGNIAVLNGSDGKFMVDAGIAVSKRRITAALQKLGPAPVRYVVDTHWHWDHTDGNAWLHDSGATIVATAATAKHLSRPTRVEEWEHTFPASPKAGLPTELVDGEKTYSLDGETIVVSRLSPAHTDGDLVVYFKNADVLVTGDTFWNGLYPFIDVGNGGSIGGTIAAVDRLLARATDHTIIVPGHGPRATREQLLDYRNMLVAVAEKVATLKGQGKSLADVLAEKPTASYDAKYGNGVPGPKIFTQVVYESVTVKPKS
jgi:glyoxylase-like metal-dependent hydrolase (beta-lactamase superfamily II)